MDVNNSAWKWYRHESRIAFKLKFLYNIRFGNRMRRTCLMLTLARIGLRTVCKRFRGREEVHRLEKVRETGLERISARQGAWTWMTVSAAVLPQRMTTGGRRGRIALTWVHILDSLNIESWWEHNRKRGGAKRILPSLGSLALWLMEGEAQVVLGEEVAEVARLGAAEGVGWAASSAGDA